VNPELFTYKKLYTVFVGLSLILAFILAVPFITSAEAAAITIIPPPDKTISTTNSLTKVSLGTPEVSGTTDRALTISNNAPGYTAAPKGAVAYWSFDDDLLDRSENKNHGTAVGDARITKSQMTQALSLDGKGDYVKVDDFWELRMTGAYSISAWIKLETLTPDGSYVRILEKGTSPGEKYWMFYVKSSSKIGFGFINSEADVNIRTTKSNWQAGQWYHIVGTYNPAGGSNNMKIYVNGVLDNQATKTGKPAANSQPLMIGAKSSAKGDFWQGQLDEIRLYGRALTATEVTSLYKSPFVSLPTGTNTITWSVKDSSGNSATAIQVVNVVNKSIITPVTSLAINGIRYVDSTTGNTFVTSATHFDLSITSTVSLKATYYRYFKTGDLIKPNFSTGSYFKMSGTEGEYSVEFYSIDINGTKESLVQKTVFLDNSASMTRLNVVSGSSDGKIRLTSVDHNGAGVGNKLTSGIYYKLDSSSSYKYVQASTVEVPNVVNGAHTIYYYSIDNLGNTESVKSAKFTGTIYTFCSSGCDYNSLQTAINALPSGGGKIFIKGGEYTLSNTITLKSGTILDFSSTASIFFRGDSKPLFKGDSISNIEVIGGEITAERTGVKAFSFTNSKWLKITGTKITLVNGINSNAFYCVDCVDVIVSKIDAKSASRLIDIKTESRTTDGLSRNIWIENGKFDQTSIEGVKVNYSTDVHIIGNTITNTAENGIDIGHNKNSEVRENRLTKTGLPSGAAIHTDSANGADIIDNYIDTTGKTAIPVYRASNINVIGNTVINSGDQGISIITKSEPNFSIKIKSNHIIAPNGNGIYQSPDQDQVELSFNILEEIPAGVVPISIIGSNPTTVEYGNQIN
jgi:hypothetical protein